MPSEKEICQSFIQRFEKRHGEVAMCLDIIKQAERKRIKVDNLGMYAEITFVPSDKARAKFKELLG